MIRFDTSQRQRVDLSVKFRRRSFRSAISVRVTRAVDRGITRVQEWLEGPDRRCDLVVAYLVIVVVVAVLVVALTRMGG